jgi:hypothetical protein
VEAEWAQKVEELRLLGSWAHRSLGGTGREGG